MTKITMIPFLQKNMGYSEKIWKKITKMLVMVFPAVIVRFLLVNEKKPNPSKEDHFHFYYCSG